ncbi:MAG: TlpA disulfide reductase family protein [Mariprofundaceae bacterium]|nr:TlpA disulfide reductase family protein [Mariprofundaceae bacterium]
MKYSIKPLLLVLALLWFSPLATATDFKWLDQQGKQHQLNEFKGAPVVLHLWASWCFPCRIEMPEMAVWLKANPKITVLPISLDQSSGDATDFLNKIGMHVPLLLSDASQLYKLGARGLPTTVLIDASGDILSVHTGVQQWKDGAWNDLLLALFKMP